MNASDWNLAVSTVEDIERCYLLILGRAPESPLVLEAMLKAPLRDLLVSFLTSAEFDHKLSVHNGQLLVEPSFLSAVDAAMISWLESIVPFGAEARQVLADLPERLTAIQLLLAHEDIGGSFRASRIGSPSDPYNLAHLIGWTLEMAKAVRSSELFDENFYGKQVGADTSTKNYALHYIVIGEPANVLPSHQFDPASYVAHNPDLSGFQGNLLYHYEVYGRKEGRSLSAASDDAESLQAAVVRNSTLFDEAYYRQQLDPKARIVDAALHYLVEGEQLGLRASAAFDAKTYSELHPDIGSSSINRLLHFEMHGRAEKRSYRWAVDDLPLATDRIDPAKQTVIVLMHQASHTGAPILGWNIGKMLLDQYNVVVVFGSSGTLEDAVHETFSAAVGPMPSEYAYMLSHHARLAQRIKKTYNPIYIIANSAETRWQGTALRSVGIPTIALVHEFTGTLPDNINRPFFPLSSAIVFPAEVVREDEERAYREIGLQNILVIPQGPSAVPPFAVVRGERHAPIMPRIAGATEPKVGDVDELFGGKRGEGIFTVVGMGAVELRKGVDFFIATAKAVAVRNPSLDFRFVWVGSWDHAVGTPHGKLLEEQIFRSQMGDKLQLVPAVEDIEKIYARADALFLSSRLDPLPNVSIDAALREVPVLCFQEASGMAELLLAHPETRDLVLPHMDIGAVAERVAELMADPELCRRLGQAVGVVGRATFNLKRYVEAIDRLGTAAYRKALHADHERDLIVAAKVFEPAIYFESGDGFEKAEADNVTVSEYLDRTRQINFANDSVWGVFPRRPAAGFHPFIYGQTARDFPAGGERDPLAHWVEAGQPEGPWKHPVIRIADFQSSSQDVAKSAKRHAATKVAVHGHFHYTDNIDDFLTALLANRSRMDLFLTTSSKASASVLARATSSYRGGSIAITVGENYGRDIAPFISLLEKQIIGRYDIVGHMHGKRSLHAKAIGESEDLGNRWREFLWQHLLGPDYPAADILLKAMIDDPTIGLLFPETDLIVGWEKNFEGAKALAGRMGIPLPLPQHIEFPVGTMFWARPKALRALIDARFTKQDYPQEPLPIDGTMLHVMERFLPMVCEAAGYRYATSYIPHIRR